MRLSRRLATGLAASAVALTGALAAAPTASAAAKPTGTRSLASVLTADKKGFDSNAHDYDIVTAAVRGLHGHLPPCPGCAQDP